MFHNQHSSAPNASFLGMTDCKLFIKFSRTSCYPEATIQDLRGALPSPSQTAVPPLPFQVNPGAREARQKNIQKSGQATCDNAKQKQLHMEWGWVFCFFWGSALQHHQQGKKKKTSDFNNFVKFPVPLPWRMRGRAMREPGPGLTAHGRHT